MWKVFERLNVYMHSIVVNIFSERFIRYLLSTKKTQFINLLICFIFKNMKPQVLKDQLLMAC